MMIATLDEERVSSDVEQDYMITRSQRGYGEPAEKWRRRSAELQAKREVAEHDWRSLPVLTKDADEDQDAEM